MIFRLVTKEYTIISNHTVNDKFEVGSNDFKFNITLSNLATNAALLKALNLVSMYAESNEKGLRMGNPIVAMSFGISEPPATKAKAIRFFRDYLNEFLRKEPRLQANDNLCVLVLDKNIQSKIVEILKPQRK